MPSAPPRSPIARRSRSRALVRVLAVMCAALGLLAMPAAAQAITVSGTAYADGSETTVWSGCDGATSRVALAVNGVLHSSAPCSALGAFTFSGVTPAAANQVLTVWFDGHADKAAHYTRNADTVTSIAGLELIRTQVVTSSQNASPITNTDIAIWDSPNDTDVPVTVTGTALTTAVSNLRMHIASGDTYAPGGDVTVPTLRVDGTYAGGAETLVVTAGVANACDTSSLSAMRPICTSTGATFTAPAVTRYATPSAASFPTTITFNALQLRPTSPTPTYTLTDEPGDLVTASSLDIGTGTAAVIARLTGGDVHVTGTTTVNALATYRLEWSSSQSEHNGSLVGAGTVTVSRSAIIEMRPPGGTTVDLGTTSGSNVWSIENLEVQNGGNTPATVRLAAGGTGVIRVTDTLDVGVSSDLAQATLDVETNDRALDVDTFFDMSSRGTYSASSTVPLTIGKDFDTDSGSAFQANLGTVVFDTATTVSRITLGNSVNFRNVSSTEPAKVLRFDPAHQTNVVNLTVNGGSCDTRAGIASYVEGSRFQLNVTGTASVQYADVADSGAVVPLTATSSTAGANNLGWTVSGTCGTVAVSGTAYGDQLGAVWSGCDGVTPNIAISVNGYAKRTTTCSPITGAYSFTTVPDPGLLVLVFMDTAGATPGATYSRAPATPVNLTGFDVTYGRVSLRSETAAPITSELMAMYDQENDPSVKVAVWEWDKIMVETAPMEFVVEAGDTYEPDNDVDMSALELRGRLHQWHVDNNVDIDGGGTSSDCTAAVGVQMPVCVLPGGSFDSDGGKGYIRFRSSAPLVVQSTTYPHIELAPAATNNAITFGHAPGTTLTVEGGLEIQYASGIFVTADTATNSPTINLMGGVSQPGTLDVEQNGTLSGTSSMLVTESITGAGTVNMSAGLIEQRVSGAKSTGPDAAGTHTYNDIIYSTSSGVAGSVGTRVGTGTITVNGTMQVGRATDAATMSVLNDDNRTFDLNGSLLIASRGALTAASLPATPFTIADDFANQGVFVANGGRVTFDDASKISSITTVSPTTFSNLTSTTPNETLRFQNAMTTTVTGTFTANGGSCGSPVALESTTSGSPWTINAGTAAVQYATLRDSTAAPARTATSAGNLGGNTGWTFSGGCAAPTTMLSHDTNASGSGVAQNAGILVDTPHVSWINNSGLAADRQRTQFVSTPVDSTVSALWHLDGSGTDVAGGGGGSIASLAAPNDAAWDAGTVQVGFGQTLDVDGDDVATVPSHSSSLDVDSFTVEAWVRLDGLTGAVGTDGVIVDKRVAADDTNFRLAVRRTSATAGVVTADISTGGAGVSLPASLVGTTNLNDGRWHHVAFVVNSAPADPGKVQTVFVDGVSEATGTFAGNVDNAAVPVSLGGTSALGEFLDGKIDEVRISAVARTAAELRGYVRTRMPHGTELWDSDATDAGITVTPNCANAARCADVTYAGPPLVRDGARYYARGKLRSTTSIWSGWSTWDWFETVSALTIGVPSGAAATLPTAIAGDDVTTTSTVTVSTNDRAGYTLSAKGPDDVWGMDGPGASVLPRWTGAPDAPTTWTAGSSGYFGLTVLSATGGKDTARWGTGVAASDFANLRYVGLRLNEPSVLHRRSTFSAATDSITTSYRANAALAQQAGSYSATITYTAVPNA